MRHHLGTIERGDYFAHVLETKGGATALGVGPRFLHSTGQAYKGGPNSGVFLTLTCEDEPDLPVPNRGYEFGVVKTAQALGDFEVLVERDRRALRLHLPADVTGAVDRVVELAGRVLGR